MTDDREQLSERYLEAQLREELGPETDLSDRVLQAVYGKPRRVIPGPKRPSAWKPLAAAAAVLIAAGLATYALVTVLPEHLRQREDSQRAVHHPRSEPPIQLPKAEQKPESQPAPGNESAPVEDGLPPEPDALPEPEPQPDDTVVKDPPPAEGGDTVVLPDPEVPGWTDPPEAWPDPKERRYADPIESAPVLVASWKGESLRVTQVGAGDRIVW